MEVIAIDNAVGQEDKNSDNVMVVAENISNGISFPCLDDNCQFKTPICEGWAREKVAWQILKDHYENNHKTPGDEKEIKGSDNDYRMWLPERLELDPNDDNGEAYQFWLARFQILGRM